MAPSENARTRVLRAALEVIGTEGLAALSNRRIAKEAGISLGSLTYYFSSQEQLLEDALQLFLGEEVQRLGELTSLLEDASLTPDEAARALEAQLRTRTDLRAAKLQLYVHAIRTPNVREAVEGCFAAYDRLATGALEAVQIPDAAAIAPLLAAMIDGLQLRRLATGDNDLTIADALGRLLAGVRSAPITPEPS